MILLYLGKYSLFVFIGCIAGIVCRKFDIDLVYGIGFLCVFWILDAVSAASRAWIEERENEI